MSSAVFPTLAGIGWDIERSPEWNTTVQENSSGLETRIPKQTYPRYVWSLTFDVLRQGVVHGVAYAEFAQLMGFYNARQGRFDSFLYTDVDDNAATNQVIGAGDGTTKTFQLVRAFGGFVEPVLAPNVVSAVKLNGVTQSGGAYTVSNWGATTPGVVTFTTAPAAGVSVSASFTYYWPCRFDDDSVLFAKFMSAMYSGRKLSFKSLKN